METIQALMAKLGRHPFITRRSDGSVFQILSDIDESIAKQHTLVSSAGEQIHDLLQVL